MTAYISRPSAASLLPRAIIVSGYRPKVGCKKVEGERSIAVLLLIQLGSRRAHLRFVPYERQGHKVESVMRACMRIWTDVQSIAATKVATVIQHWYANGMLGSSNTNT